MSLFLLNFGKPVTFVHVPKTGGSSIRESRTLEGPNFYNPPPQWHDTPSFGFVRNPFDRLESAWRDFRFARKMISLTFEQLVAQLPDILRPELIGNPSTFAHHIAPMTHPIHGLQHAQFVGCYEHLEEDLQRFCWIYRLKAPTLPRLRDSQDAPRAEWTDALRARAKKLYADDFELYESPQVREAVAAAFEVGPIDVR